MQPISTSVPDSSGTPPHPHCHLVIHATNINISPRLQWNPAPSTPSPGNTCNQYQHQSQTPVEPRPSRAVTWYNMQPISTSVPDSSGTPPHPHRHLVIHATNINISPRLQWNPAPAVLSPGITCNQYQHQPQTPVEPRPIHTVTWYNMQPISTSVPDSSGTPPQPCCHLV